MTVKKSELESGMDVKVEVSTLTSFKSDVFQLEIDEVYCPFEKPEEFTGYDEKGRKFRGYLDVKKLECVQNENNEFVGCVGSIIDIFEPFEE